MARGKRSLGNQIHEVTGIALPALQNQPLAQFNTEESFQWTANRNTTREEDWAYCLLGIFGVYMPPLYGEGKRNVVRRLRKEVVEAMNREDTPESVQGIINALSIRPHFTLLLCRIILTLTQTSHMIGQVVRVPCSITTTYLRTHKMIHILRVDQRVPGDRKIYERRNGSVLGVILAHLIGNRTNGACNANSREKSSAE